MKKMSLKPWTMELGTTLLDGRIKFKVWAPKVSSVSLILPGDSVEFHLTPEDKGYFTACLDSLKGGTKYFYLLNGKQQRPDPVSRSQPEGVHGPSEVIDPGEFQWEDQAWPGIPLQEMIIYEIHTGTFTPEGTFQAIIPRLSYLKDELGVNSLELMPVGQFPGARNWGYDGTYPYAPQNSYGGSHGLKTLINACHLRGLAVILDVVYNHPGPEGNYLGDFGNYFTDRYKTPWGPTFNFDGPESDEVRKYIIDNALYWVTENHFDGLRIDAVHGIFDFSPRHILQELQEAVHRQAGILGRSIVVIAESCRNDVRVIEPPAKAGYGLDAQWNDDFHHSLHALLTKERNSYYKDFGDLNQLAKALREGFVYSGQYSSFWKRRQGSSSKHLSPEKFVVFSQNHDQVGNRIKGERMTSLVSFEAIKLAAGVVLLAPNIPLLFMGEEYGEDAPFLYFINHSDPSLIEAVRRGRREEWADFSGVGEPPDPQDEWTFLQSKVHPALVREGNHKILFNYYKALINLRKKIPSLSHLSKAGLRVEVLGKKPCLWVLREYEEERLGCLFNFSSKSQRVNIPVDEGGWLKIFDSLSIKWGGPGGSAPESIPSSDFGTGLIIGPYALLLYRK